MAAQLNRIAEEFLKEPPSVSDPPDYGGGTWVLLEGTPVKPLTLILFFHSRPKPDFVRSRLRQSSEQWHPVLPSTRMK